MRADAIPRNWLFEVCSKVQPTQLPRSDGPCRPVSRLALVPTPQSRASASLSQSSLAAAALSSHSGATFSHPIVANTTCTSQTVHRCRLRIVLHKTLPSHSPFPRRHLMQHSASPKSKQPACLLCLKLGYEACIKCGMRGLGPEAQWLMASLWAPSYDQLP
jgi:hypothetical protein